MAKMGELLEGLGWRFLTLTYPSWVQVGTPEECKGHLYAFVKRLRRRGALGVVWRLQPQTRGVPHWHLLVHGPIYLPQPWIKAVWGEIIGYSAPDLQVDVRARDWRTMQLYVSRYVAREESWEEGGACTAPASEAAAPEGRALLDAGAYPAAWIADWWKTAGRRWGMLDRKLLPWADTWLVDLSARAWWELRRGLRRDRGGKWGRGGAGVGGWTFINAGVEWVRWALALGGEVCYVAAKA